MIVRFRDLVSMVQLSRSTIYELMRKDSTRYDPSFPRPIKLSKAAIGWLRKDIDRWLAKKRGIELADNT